MVILNNISVLQENLLKELGILATMTRVYPIAKIEKLWMDVLVWMEKTLV